MAVTEMTDSDDGNGRDRFHFHRSRLRNRDSSHTSSGGIARRLLLLLLAVVQTIVISESLSEAPKIAAATTADVATAFNQQQQSRHLSRDLDLSDTITSNGYDDTRRMGCIQDVNKKLTQFPDSVAMDYMTSMTMMDLVKQRHYMAIQTMYSNKDGVVDHYRNACENVAGGIFVSSDFLVLECNKTHHSYADDDDNDDDVKEPPYNVTATEIYINNGECFTKGDACQHYVDHPDDWLLDTKQLFGNTCEIRDDFQTIDDAYESLISHPDNVPYIDIPAFVDATPPNYSKDRQKKCMSAFKRWIFDDKYEKVTDEALYHASRTHIDLLQISVDPPPTRVVQREYYGMDDDKDDADRLQAYQDLCKEANGRFDSFTSILDCIGVGGTNWNRRQTILTQNAATCFPTSGCDDYTMEQWRIDTLMSTINLSCTVRSKDEGDHVVDAQPPSNNEGSRTPQSGGSGGSGGEEEENDSKQTITVSGVTLVLTLVAGLGAASVAYRRKVQQQRSGENFDNIPQEDEPVVGLTMIDPHHHNNHSKNNYTDHVELGELS